MPKAFNLCTGPVIAHSGVSVLIYTYTYMYVHAVCINSTVNEGHCMIRIHSLLTFPSPNASYCTFVHAPIHADTVYPHASETGSFT